MAAEITRVASEQKAQSDIPGKWYVLVRIKKVHRLIGYAEVAQQSKARRKEDFLNAFSPVWMEALMKWIELG